MERLIELEKFIAHDQEGFCKIGKALKEIRDNRLYKLVMIDTFEIYARSRWDMSRAYAYRLIKAYELTCNLLPIGDKLPANESQARPLIQLDPMEQRSLWKEIINSGIELTAVNIKKFINARKDASKSRTDLTDPISDDYMAAVQAMIEQVRMARNDRWQQTSRQAALLWHRVIREKIVSKEAGHG